MYITEKGKTYPSWNIRILLCLLWPAILGQHCSVCRITCSPGQPSPATSLPCRAASASLHFPHRWYKTPEADWHRFCRRVPKAMSCTVESTKDADLCVKEEDPIQKFLARAFIRILLSILCLFSLSFLSASALLHLWSYFWNNQEQTLLFKIASQSSRQRTHGSDFDLFINLLKRMCEKSGLLWALARPFEKKNAFIQTDYYWDLTAFIFGEDFCWYHSHIWFGWEYCGSGHKACKSFEILEVFRK